MDTLPSDITSIVTSENGNLAVAFASDGGAYAWGGQLIRTTWSFNF
ncbi:MAG: hypothetical protein LBP35_03350 [Candidatus Ancillula trichonymphae]|nr:hypothetical protein [Candidatus Ancillula trichonymphae]